MKRMLPLLSFVAAMAAWCPPSFAQRQAAIGPGIIPLDGFGELNGVDMSGSGITGTLTVGTQDIFSTNGALATTPLAVSTGAGSQGNILFSGNSTVFGGIGTNTLGLLNIDVLGGTVNFLGTVFATTLDVGTGTVNFNSGTISNTTATNFTDDGTISLAPNTVVIGALTTTAGSQTGTLVLGSGSQLTGAVGPGVGLRAINVVGGSDTAGVSATIVGEANAFSFSLGTNTLNVGGALTLANGAPGGVINTTLASQTLYGNIQSTGAVTLGAALDVLVTVPATSFLTPGTLFDIVEGPGPGGSVVTVTSLNPLYTFVPVPAGGTIGGFLTIELTGIPLQASPDPIVDVILDLPLTPDLTEVLGAINALTDPDSVSDAVAQLVPSTTSLAVPLVTFQRARQFQGLWLSRLDMCRNASQPDEEDSNRERSACEDDPQHGWWIKGFGYFGEQDSRRNSTGYDADVFGTMIAYDAPLGLDTRAGLGVGYARSEVSGEKFDADSDVDTYRAMAYIGHEAGPWFFNGSASFGWNEYSDRRHIVFPGVNRTADADYDGQDYTAFLGTGFHLSALGLTITPLASLQYTRVHLDDYRESGAGDVNLDVDDQGYDFLESGLGAQVEAALGSWFVPEVHFNWFHALLNPRMAQRAEFTVPNSQEFKTKGLKTDRDTFNVGGGLTLLSCECGWGRWSVEAVYDYDWRTDEYSAHEGALRFTSRF